MLSGPTIILAVPRPPSANAMFQRRLTKRGKRNLTPEYKAWRDKAGWLAKVQVIGIPPIDVRFDAAIEVPISRRDTDNHIKPLLDLLQNIGLITNDGNANEVRIVPVDREDCMIALTPRPDLGHVRTPAKRHYGGHAMPQKPTAARLRKVEAVRGRVMF